MTTSSARLVLTVRLHQTDWICIKLSSGCDYTNSDIVPDWSDCLAELIVHSVFQSLSTLTSLCDCASGCRDINGQTIQLCISPCCACDWLRIVLREHSDQLGIVRSVKRSELEVVTGFRSLPRSLIRSARRLQVQTVLSKCSQTVFALICFMFLIRFGNPGFVVTVCDLSEALYNLPSMLCTSAFSNRNPVKHHLETAIEISWSCGTNAAYEARMFLASSFF